MTEKDKQVKELKDKIKVLEQLPGAEEQELVRKYKDDLARLQGKEIKETMSEENQDTTFEIPSMSEEEYEAAGSKFAQEGVHLSEMGMPSWDTPGKSIAFPFTIIEEGEDAGKESKISAGVSKDAVWKLKEILKAVGVSHSVINGKVTFDGMECVGKKFGSVWIKQLDKRSPEEGGKGGTYTKATGAIAIKDEVQKDEGV